MELSPSDDLHELKRDLIAAHSLEGSAPALPLPTLLSRARILVLRKDELYALAERSGAVHAPINPRNEAAALSLLVTHKSELCGDDRQRLEELEQLTSTLAHAPCPRSSASEVSTAGAAERARSSSAPAPSLLSQEGPAAQLMRWACGAGASTKLVPAVFPADATATSSAGDDATCSSSGRDRSDGQRPAGLRGMAATQHLPAGSLLLAVPVGLLISYATAAASDFGAALRALPSLRDDPESLAVVWTLVERHDGDADSAPFWRALPASFGTGLSAPQEKLELLRGTPLYARALQARKHIAASFEALQPVFKALLGAYGAHLRAEWFSWEAYLWAVELWYAYAIQVALPDGQVRPCLVPVACLINHSACPHAVRFSTVNAASGCLEIHSLRPAAAGEQVCLSYGPLPNEYLLLFYGFCLERNPFDAVPALPLRPVQRPAAVQAACVQLAAALAALGGAGSHVLTAAHPRPHQLAAAAKLAAASTEAQAAELAEALRRAAGGSADAADPACMRLGRAAAAVAAACPELSAAAEKLLEPTLRQAVLYQAALARVTAALSAADGQPASSLAFLGHARTYVAGLAGILQLDGQ